MRRAPLALDPSSASRAACAASRPTVFRAGVPAEEEALEALLRSGEVLFVHDTLAQQLEELADTRAPGRKLTPEARAEGARAIAGDEPPSFGAWVHYPWSGRLVRVLPEREFEELRTSRNRNKITRDEQTRLGALRIGVTGLSVGQSTAVTLALEGIGGAFRLADFDTLSLSNMNRLRAGVHEIGLNKAVLAARAIYEINPYARIEVFERGIDDATIGPFFSESEPLDLLIEECDDLKMKFRLRLEARRRGIPVLMETSDRGLIDVERFDLEPDRPLFHGLVEELDPERLSGMGTHEKIAVVLDILGTRTISRRLAASLIDVDSTLKTWPQLASAVALGGALNADVARRIALGSFRRSGRFWVDLEALVADPPRRGGEETASPPEAAQPAGVRHMQGGARAADADLVERLVARGALAPSGGNCQPWSFTYAAGRLRCWHDPVRSRSLLDHEHRASYAAFGALAENLRLAAGAAGVAISLRAFPEPSDPLLVCEAVLGSAAAAAPAPARPFAAEDADLAAQIERRTTNRRIDRRSPLPASHAGALQRVAAEAGATLHLLTDEGALASVGEAVGLADRLRMTSPVMHREMMGELRWSPGEALATRDGLDLRTLELTPADRAALGVIADWPTMETLREIGGGVGLGKSSRDLVAASAAVGLLVVPGAAAGAEARRQACFQGGVAMQRVWLTATQLGIAFQPMTAIVYLAARLDDGGEGLAENERRELAVLRDRYRALFGRAGAATEILLFRLAIAPPPTARSLRREVSDILMFEERPPAHG